MITLNMEYDVRIGKRALKRLEKAPKAIQEKMHVLFVDLKTKGPIRNDWPNFSALSPTRYHCHLGYSWVACWQWEKGTVSVEVYYVGSREGAPY